MVRAGPSASYHMCVPPVECGAAAAPAGLEVCGMPSRRRKLGGCRAAPPASSRNFGDVHLEGLFILVARLVEIPSTLTFGRH